MLQGAIRKKACSIVWIKSCKHNHHSSWNNSSSCSSSRNSQHCTTSAPKARHWWLIHSRKILPNQLRHPSLQFIKLQNIQLSSEPMARSHSNSHRSTSTKPVQRKRGCPSRIHWTNWLRNKERNHNRWLNSKDNRSHLRSSNNTYSIRSHRIRKVKHLASQQHPYEVTNKP